MHPHCKYIPGRRLARSMMGVAYGAPASVPYLSPAYAYATATSVTTQTPPSTQINVTVHFRGGTTGGGLVVVPDDPLSNSSHCPTERGVNATYCDAFAVQVNDAYPGTWYNATALVGAGGETLVLSVTVPKPGLAAVATRNGYSDWPVTTVYTTDGLPVLTWMRPLTA